MPTGILKFKNAATYLGDLDSVGLSINSSKTDQFYPLPVSHPDSDCGLDRFLRKGSFFATESRRL